MAFTDFRIPSASADQVAIFDDNFRQVFEQARPLKLTVAEHAKVMEHPVETGATITDHRILEPIEIEYIALIQSADYRSVYQQIRQIYQNAGLLTVQSKTASYEHMLISEIPHEENPDYFDAIQIVIKMKEVFFVTAQFGMLPPAKVADKTQASTVDIGTKQTTEVAADPNKSGLAVAFDGLRGR